MHDRRVGQAATTVSVNGAQLRMTWRWGAAGVAAAAVAHAGASVSVLGAISGRGPSTLGPVRLRASRSDAVGLTFDDGPSPDTTPRVLALLDRLGVHATFFVLGSAVREHPGLIADILARGHEVASHGTEHRHHLVHSPRWIEADVARSVAVLGSVGVTPRFFRPPYGQVATASLTAAARHGMATVLWSGWGREWADRDPANVAARALRRFRAGSIVLLHDSDELCGPGSVATVEAALPTVLDAVSRRGLVAVTLSELCR
jgi:peptidoglycan-N-acetylglucosamine deacetylase